MATAQRRVFLAAQWLFAVAIVWYAAAALRGQWRNAAERLQSLHPDWPWIMAATVIVLLTYGLLIATWRQVIVASGESLPFSTAARIWFVSNLGKYVPGKIWSIAAMTVMARENNVSPVTAAGSSVLVQLVSVASGIGVILATGAQAMDRPGLALAAAGAIVLLLAATPRLLPLAGKIASSLTGKNLELPRMKASTVWMVVGASSGSWIAYGVAFQFFVRGVIGTSAGAPTSYIAVYAASYIIGFLALFAPGGAVVRESAMVTLMLRFALSGQVDALAVAVASRLWLTFTELLPGLGYMALGKRTYRN